MIKSKKQMFLVIGIFALMLFVGGVTYAFFNYTRTGAGNTIRVGRIAFISRQTETISLTNLFPIDPTETGVMDDEEKVGTLEIEIEGDTDYVDGVEYLISTVNSSITSNGKTLPISLDVTVTNLGTSNDDYFTARESKNATIYKKLIGDTLKGDEQVLVGYIKPNTTSGTKEGVNGKITIKAYLDKNKILISDTYNNGEEPTDNLGTPVSMGEGKTVFTTSEWNALQQNGVSFQIKVEANEGIWVEEVRTLYGIMQASTIGIDIENGVDFSKTSEQDNTKGVYTFNGTENDTYPVYYYRGAVEDNNVVFANKCWKAVRTTDTGGVKLIYNGVSSPVYEEIPIEESDYTINTTNTDSRWTYDSSDNTWNIEINDNSHPAIEFTVPERDNYTLIMTGTSGSDCGGDYKFYKNGTLITDNYNGWGEAMDLTYEYGTLTATDVIEMDYTGSSSSTCVITFKLKMVGQGEKIADNSCNNTGTDTHISLDVSGTPTTTFAFNTSYNSPAYVGYMYGDVYTYTNASATSGTYWSDVQYNGTVYELKTGGTTSVGLDTTHHYICEDSSSCRKLRYYYYTNYYIEIENGDTIESAIEKMQTNTNPSNAKTQIDTWYGSNMTGVTNKLEDTIWCNDRSIGRYNGWSSTGTINGTRDYKNYSLLFGAHERSNYASGTSTTKNQPSLACANKNDAFTVSNGNGNQALTYPVALLTKDEMVLAGGLAGTQNTTFYLNNGSNYWFLSPFDFDNHYAYGFDVYSGYITFSDVRGTSGLRPSVSLKPGTPVISGDGTSTSPYIIVS